MRRFLLILSSLILVFILPRPTVAKEQCFIDTAPYCFVGTFSSFWASNGALPVFGYPISIAQFQVGADQKTYLTQWAERNRFEFHPENAGTSYEVLLGLLGKERLLQLKRDIDPRETGAIAGCLWFEETGHNVCDQASNLGFKSYWLSHGLQVPGLDPYARSLQLFGLPLTGANLETNANGDTVLTQWFERARIEWHPNNPDEFKVLLGLLGSEVLGPQSPIPASPRICTDIPASISASISKACFNAGEQVSFSFDGFQPNEKLFMWDIAENGEVTTVNHTANASGHIQGSFVGGVETAGFWQWSVKGLSSNHIATIYFRQTGQIVIEPTPPPSQPRCHSAYPDVCIPPPPPDLDCDDIPYSNFRVLSPDPHRFDGDKDGIGCES